MGTRDPDVDAYIERAAPLARDVLRHLRDLVHAACPGASETMRTGRPSFEYHGLLCAMGAFEDYCTFGFWQAAMRAHGDDAGTSDAMGAFGRITRIADLPKDGTVKALVRRAAKLNAMGVKSLAAGGKRGPLVVPKDLGAALRANGSVRAAFKSLSRDRQRAFVQWIENAKRPETRARRVAGAIEAMLRDRPAARRYGRTLRPAGGPRR